MLFTRIYLLFLLNCSLFRRIMKHFFLMLAACVTCSVNLLAQNDRKDKTAVTYEEIYDEPYSVNKLFVHFQPLYGELFVSNVNAGFGLEANYYHADKADFRAHFRKTYTENFYDFSRYLAKKTSDVANEPTAFTYFEVGGTYHIKDFEESSKTKMFLYKNSYKGNKWAARVPLEAEVPCKVRKIYGARVGGILWQGTTDINKALTAQELSNSDLRDVNIVDETYNSLPQDIDVFSNISSTGVYLGGSMTWIKNVAVNFDKFEEGIDDLIFTAYFDVLYSPSIVIDDVVYDWRDPNTNQILVTGTYSTNPIKTKTIGFRAGIEGKFNRTLSWAYGGEIGYRPSIVGRTFYAMLKISFPVFSTNLDYKVESFGK